MINHALATLAILAAALAAASMSVSESELVARGTELVPTVEVCTGSVGTGCVNIPVVNDNCVNFTGGLTFLNRQVSSAVIPGGYVCIFVENFGCDSTKGSAVVLQGGSWNFANVPGPNGNINFNDKAGSFVCFPV